MFLSFLSDRSVFAPSSKCAENTAMAGKRERKTQKSSQISKEMVNTKNTTARTRVVNCYRSFFGSLVFPLLLRVQSRSRTRSRIELLFRAWFKGALDAIAPQNAVEAPKRFRTRWLRTPQLCADAELCKKNLGESPDNPSLN